MLIKTITRFCFAVTFISVISCSSQPKETTLKAPSYAARTGAEDFIVNCLGRSVSVMGTSKELFYSENGELLSLNEFCKKFNTNTIINR